VLGHTHSIYVFDAVAPEKDYWKPQIFSRITGYISKGYAVVYVAEHDETTTVRHFSRLGFPVEDHIESGALTIINKNVFYSPEVRGHLLNEQWAKVFATIEKKRGKENIKGYVGIGMPSDSYFASEMYQQRLVDYEALVADNYTGGFEAMCCYTTEMFDRMPLKYIIMLLNSHQNTAHSGGQYKQWTSERCIEIIQNGLNSALGPGVAELIFSILLKDFEMDKDAMVAYPDRLESRLRFLLGTSAADIVVGKVKKEFIRATTY
jgi:MEDS: MEthanogen/methylotroph, DcmR Sensory domain